MEPRKPLTLKEQIELITTEDLLNALMGRFDCAFFVGTFRRNQEQIRSSRFVGDPHTVIGLATNGARRIGEKYDEDERPLDPHEL